MGLRSILSGNKLIIVLLLVVGFVLFYAFGGQREAIDNVLGPIGATITGALIGFSESEFVQTFIMPWPNQAIIFFVLGIGTTYFVYRFFFKTRRWFMRSATEEVYGSQLPARPVEVRQPIPSTAPAPIPYEVPPPPEKKPEPA